MALRRVRFPGEQRRRERERRLELRSGLEPVLVPVSPRGGRAATSRILLLVLLLES